MQSTGFQQRRVTHHGDLLEEVFVERGAGSAGVEHSRPRVGVFRHRSGALQTQKFESTIFKFKQNYRTNTNTHLAGSEHVEDRLSTHVGGVDDVILLARVSGRDGLCGGDGEGRDVADEFFRRERLLNTLRRNVRLTHTCYMYM